MEQYIPKSALVAEIRKRLLPVIRDKHYDEWEEGQDSERIAILGIIDALEVKEVDFDAEWERYFEHRGEMATVNVKHLAKHFFKLGMSASNKAQKGDNI